MVVFMAFTNEIPLSDKESVKLFISSSLVERILQESLINPDEEICGLLIGKKDLITEIWPMVNVAPDPRRFFQMDEAALIQAHRDARNRYLNVIGHYHSHPSGSCRPSPRDAALAHDGQYWLIAASNKIEGWYAGGNGMVEGIFHSCSLVLK